MNPNVVVDAAGGFTGELLVVTAVVALTVIDGLGLGLVFSWLLIAYLVYRFTPMMVPERVGGLFEPGGDGPRSGLPAGRRG